MLRFRSKAARQSIHNPRSTTHDPRPVHGSRSTVYGPESTVHVAFALVLALTLVCPAFAQSVEFLEADGDVWLREQVVTGRITDAGSGSGEIVVGERSWPILLSGETFAVSVTLEEGLNAVIAQWENSTGQVATDTLHLTLPFTLRPEAELIPMVEGRTVTLDGKVLANPDSSALTFVWEADPNNPAGLSLVATSDSLATVTIPETHPLGTYFFNWTVTDADGDAFRARTFVVVDSTDIDPFDLRTEHAPWIDRTVLYEITPRSFTFRGNLQHIIDRIPELVELGVTTLWIQPIYLSTHDQGYAVLDYFTVRPQFGTEEDVHALVEAAHAAGLQVLFDFVPNHSDINHRYAQDAIANGQASQYYDFYMRERDSAPYSQHYNTLTEGEMTFVYYFWEDLVNFNYDNPAVQRFIIEASRYWIEEFDIDGYRFDAVWAPAARNPQFMLEWRRALKRLKPEILMLAEDKARVPNGFPSPYAAFDVAYDWDDDADWISKWRFQLSDEEHTVFNTAESRRAFSILGAIGPSWAPDEPILRYLENNDMTRFVVNHTVAMTKVAATLMYTLPGVPMLYNGQETGFEGHPYSTSFVYNSSLPIREHGNFELYTHYRHLNWLKTNLAPLHTLNYEDVDAGSSRLLAFRRWSGDQHVLVVINPETTARTATLELDVQAMGLANGKTYYLTDLFGGPPLAYQAADLAELEFEVPPETALVFALGAEPVLIPSDSESEPGELPSELRVAQNYPNPFTDRTTLAFTLPTSGPVRVMVYDVLGRRVLTPLDAHLTAGTHTLEIDAASLPAGTYFYRVQQADRMATGAMTKVR